MDNKTTVSDFNLAVILHNFIATAKRLILFALILTLLAGLITYFYTDRNYSPKYSASAVFAVSATYASTTDITSRSDWIDANTAKTLSQTFPYVIKSENTNMLLLQALGKNSVNGTITATATSDVGIFTLMVTSSSAQDAFDILYAVIDVYPQAAGSILGDTQIEILNEPLEPPTEPNNANNALKQALTYSSIVFLLCLLLIFLLSLTRKTIHSAQDLQRLFNMKCLAYIPNVQLKKHSKATNLTITVTNPRVGASFNESVRNLRVKLKKLLPEQQCHILLITSTLPNEGKSTVATNLALSLSAEGKRVILIDGDLRKQSLKAALGVDQASDGLVEILRGNSQNFRLLNVPKSTLLLLSGDETTDQPQPLLDSPRMGQVLKLLRSKLDFIIIDTPPAGILSDAVTISKYVDAAIYVVRQDLASSTQIFDSIQSLETDGVRILGCVLNQTQAGTTQSGYGSKYANSYGYSYGYKYASDAYHYGSKSSHYAQAASGTDTPVDFANAQPEKPFSQPEDTSEELQDLGKL